MDINRLIHMANQIADFFKAYPQEEAVAGVAGHLRQFWNPHMRGQILNHLEAGGEGLHPLTAAALKSLGHNETNTP